MENLEIKNKAELLAKVGNMQQVAYLRQLQYLGGKEKNLRCCEFKADKLNMKIMLDKCLDIAELNYKGVNLSFLSKPGLQAVSAYDSSADDGIYSIMGGFLFTCGLDNTCPPCQNNDKFYPMHGRLRTIPAENIVTEAYWDGDIYRLKVGGEMRQAALFNENLLLKRTITSQIISPNHAFQEFTICDEITNEGFKAEPYMLLYHINFGYPFLDEATEIHLNSKHVKMRDSATEYALDKYNSMPDNKDGEPEYVYIHDLARDENNNVLARIVNKKFGIAVELTYNADNLPYFMQWISGGSGDYALALEPTNSGPYGRKIQENSGEIAYLNPFEKITNVLKFKLIDLD